MVPASRSSPRTIRHGRQRRHGAGTTLAKGVAVSLAVLLVSSVSVAAYAVYWTGREIVDNAVDINQPGQTQAIPDIADFEGGFNVLLVGVDNDPEQDPGLWGDRDETILNDVNLLIHVAEDHQSGVVLSFPRDLMIPHPECVDPESGDEFPAAERLALNQAFMRGGLSCVVNTVSELTDLQIPFAAYITFDGVIGMTDAVGGVPICLAEPVQDDESLLNLPAGISNVSGADALALLRTRKSIGDGSDLSRIAVQQQYMSSLVRTLKDDGTLTDIPKLYTLARTAARTVVLSTELANPTTMISMAQTLRTMNLESLNFVQYPVNDDPYDSNRVVPNWTLADELTEMIATDAPFATDPNARRPGVEETPSTQTPVVPPDAGVSDPADPPAADSTPPVTGTPTGPPVVDGLVGQDASQESCIVAN